ncbi:concanavalin A-like lectin/glucanase [Neocallimastix lanati (nom. inval.)]|nr:concanavalin A-like lectin/glucanase [Neocallimastix sp. JGI-2020a]
MMLVTNYGLSSNKNITLYDNGFFFCSFSNSNKNITLYDNGFFFCSFSNSNKNITLYDNGFFFCSFSNSNKNITFSKTYKEIEYMYADFKLIKQNIQNIKNVDYSFIDFFSNKKFSTTHIVIQNSRHNLSFDIDDDDNLTQYFRKMCETKILLEIGNNGIVVVLISLILKFTLIPTNHHITNICSANIIAQGYKCCFRTCTRAKEYTCCKSSKEIFYTENDWNVENNY